MYVRLTTLPFRDIHKMYLDVPKTLYQRLTVYPVDRVLSWLFLSSSTAPGGVLQKKFDKKFVKLVEVTF